MAISLKAFAKKVGEFLAKPIFIHDIYGVENSAKYKALKQAFDGLDEKYIYLSKEHQALIWDWNNLIGIINENGGMSRLTYREATFTLKEIQRLIILCHPDRHEGKDIAVIMTQRLLEARDAIKQPGDKT